MSKNNILAWSLSNGNRNYKKRPIITRPVDIKTFKIVAKAENFTELRKALSDAKSRDTVFIPNDATITITDEPVKIPRGVILSSDRGHKNSLGGLIQYDASIGSTNEILRARINSRITGLRIQGPSDSTADSKQVVGILVESSTSVEVDHCEIFNCPQAGIKFSNSKSISIDGRVHHNYIHDCRKDNRGYGVETKKNVNITIEDNIFYNNRHDVAGKGSDCSYTAQYNVIKSAYKNFQRFDMHGTGPNGYGETAGETIVIQYNTIQWGSDGKKHKAIKIRGIPTNSATIQYNDFKDDSEKAAIAIYDKEGNEIYDKSEHPEFKIANNNYRCQWI